MWMRSLPCTIFLSTPSARRATFCRNRRERGCRISIHALREEGDLQCLVTWSSHRYFYPRPPRGGRRCVAKTSYSDSRFLSTPSARRATCTAQMIDPELVHFYPRPPRGGRRHQLQEDRVMKDFYPRPPRGGRLSRSTSKVNRSVFLSTPSARRATRRFCRL